jgi:hypothetical protein
LATRGTTGSTASDSDTTSWIGGIFELAKGIRMSWRNRETGHVVLEEADFSQLAKLPPGVGFRIYSRTFKGRPIWLIGTGTAPRGKQWDPGNHPFAEGSPNGSRTYISRIQQLAQPFCQAIDALAEENRKLPKDEWPISPLTQKPFRPFVGRSSRQIGELSLGQQMATLLEVPILSFISDPDSDDELSCINEPGKVHRILYQRSQLVLEFVEGVLSISPECPEFLLDIPNVRTAVPRRKYNDTMHGMVIKEIDAFAGKGFSDPDQILPGVEELSLIGERSRDGRHRSLK